MVPPTNRYYHRTWRTNAKGEFTINELEPVEYIVGLNIGVLPTTGKSPVSEHSPHAPYPITYYPGVSARESAQVFRLERGQVIDLGDWAVPALLKERMFDGVVRWPEGKPVDGARVFLGPPGYSLSLLQRAAQPTGADGAFAIWGLEGLSYRVSAVVHDSAAKSYHWGGTELKNGEAPPQLVLDQREPNVPFQFRMEFASGPP